MSREGRGVGPFAGSRPRTSLRASRYAGGIASAQEGPIVMRTGGIVEAGDTRQIMSAPREPYTRALIEAVPRL